MPAPSVLLLTAARLPALSADDQPLLAAFRDAGWDPRPAVWSDPIPDADLAIIRSCWDYTERPEAFLAAIAAIGARMPLWNPPETVRWNAHKRYLLELAAAGIPVPAGVVVAEGQASDPIAVARELGATSLVVKPAIGASGHGTLRLAAADQPAWHRATAGREVLVQPFIPEVVTAGEWSLMYFHGDYSHAVIKRARPGEFRVQEEHGGTVEPATPPMAVRRAAERALAAVGHPWHYARVDGVVSAGQFLVMELELIEPSLFLTGTGAAARMVPRRDRR